MGFASVAALAGCGDEGAAPVSSAPVAIGTDEAASTSDAGVVPTTRAAEASTATSVTGDTVVVEGDGEWMSRSFAGFSSYVGPPLEEVLNRTTDGGVVLHAYTMGDQGPRFPATGGPGWSAAPWCNPVSSLYVTMRLGEAVGIGQPALYTEPFGGISVQPIVSGYAEGTPFTVLVVQATPDVTSLAATFADGTIDSVETHDGLALLAAPTAPDPQDVGWSEYGPSGPAYTLSVYRGADIVEIDSADVPFPREDDYRRECEPPRELPEPGEQPADPAAAEQAVREVFEAVFDLDARAEGDRSWLQHLDSDEGVEAAIEEVLSGAFADAAGTADYTMGDVVFTSPTEAWFTYDLFANDNNFDDRFGVATQIDGVWKISRGVLCQDLALAGAYCDPPIGQLYPPTD